MIMMEKYRNIDLVDDPIIIPPCGHMITVSSLDGILDFGSHYNISASGEVTGLKAKSEPFSVAELKPCPQCRGSLHTISRYGRITRRAKLDELTKKFTSWSNAEIMPLMQVVREEQDRLAKLQAEERDHRPVEGEQAEDRFMDGGDSPGNLAILELSGQSYAQIDSLAKAKGARHHTLITMHRKLRGLNARLQTHEQPFQRVHDLVENLRSRAAASGTAAIAPFEFDTHMLQVTGELRARATLIRCELALISDALHCLKLQRAWSVPARDFSENVARCEQLRAMAEGAVAPRQMVEADVFAARFVVLSVPTGTEAERKKEIEAAMARLERAGEVMAKHPGSTAGLAGEVDAVRSALRGAVYYQPVTSEEMKQVYEAMANEFGGTGLVHALRLISINWDRHWYYCENRHPFTIGECGMAMQAARCPQCGAPVGGQDHRTVAGVTSAEDIEREFGRLRV
jgi:hypothetical protein